MPKLTVRMGGADQVITFASGRTVRDILDATDVQVRSGCRGMGACGLCRIRIESGKVSEPTSNEKLHLSHSHLSEGVRLACQISADQDLEITVLALAPKSCWRKLPRERGRPVRPSFKFPGEEAFPMAGNPYGVAVDLGTTNINISLYELSSGQWLGGRYGLNPQMIFGSDVMTRLVAAFESPEQARKLRRLVFDGIGEGLLSIAGREGINLQQVVRLVLVGNTAMIALLSGRNYDLLLQPGYWMIPIDCLPKDTESWVVSWGLHKKAKIQVMPPLAGFVGSDLLAGLVATHLTESREGSLFIDFGTNSEIALWDGQVLWATSAAGGPAFEGSGISCGSPVEPGAIYRFRMENDEFEYFTIGGSQPHGICGSGLVDLIAGLRRSGLLTEVGRFAPSVPKAGFTFAKDHWKVVLTKGDVDKFQRAKAAVGAGIQVLLVQAGMRKDELRRVCVGGNFGRLLDVANAREIGLLPGVQPEMVELCGNTALIGCEDILLSPAAAEQVKGFLKRANAINLSQCPDFEQFFLENLYLQKM